MIGKTLQQWRIQIVVLATALLSCSGIAAQIDSSSVLIHQFFIDDAQKIIDRLDQVQDNDIRAGSETDHSRLRSLYFNRVDSLQELINQLQLPVEVKIKMLDRIYYVLREVNKSNILDLDKFEQLFRLMYFLVTEKRPEVCVQHLLANLSSSFKIFEFFAHEYYTEDFLKQASKRSPEIILSHYHRFEKQEYTERVVVFAACEAPGTIKKYFVPENPIYKLLIQSKDTRIREILLIHELYGKTTSAYALLDPILKKKLTITRANAIAGNRNELLIHLLDTRSESNPAGCHTLEKELERISLQMIRRINDMHDETDALRFSEIDLLSKEELYTIMVYAQEEIFTSSFNGCFRRFLNKLNGYNGRDFLLLMGDNRFRSFLKMCSGFGKLQDFLNTMSPHQRKELIEKLGANLDADANGLSQAVDVADILGSIQDSTTQTILKDIIIKEYRRVKKENNSGGTLLYGLLLHFIKNPGESLIEEKKKFPFYSAENLPSEQLFNADDESNWLICFYDDKDGEASFASFLSEFRDKNWMIADSGKYVFIQSVAGRAVNILANKPKEEYEGQTILQKWFYDRNIDPAVLVHRGHSYYAQKTIERLSYHSKIFILGSCGGFNSISSVLDRAPDVSIISSKQIGTMYVNNPLLKIIAEQSRMGKSMKWGEVWNILKNRVAANKEAYNRFLDYIPPHKNQAAMFIRAYNLLMHTTDESTVDQ